MNKTRKINAEEHVGRFTCMFSATATLKGDLWNIHMYADYVDSEDVTTPDNPMPIMVEMHKRYVDTVTNKFGGVS